MNRVATAVRAPDAGQSRKFIHSHPFPIKARATRHRHSRVERSSQRVVGIRDRLLFDEQEMPLKFSADFFTQRLASRRTIIAKLLHPFNPDIMEMGLIGGRTVGGFQFEGTTQRGHHVFESVKRLRGVRHETFYVSGGGFSIPLEHDCFGVFDFGQGRHLASCDDEGAVNRVYFRVHNSGRDGAFGEGRQRLLFDLRRTGDRR